VSTLNKYKAFIFVFFLLFLVFIYKVDGYHVRELPLLQKVIYLDAGHGGADPGALYKDLYEKDINLEITRILETYLEEKGAIVYLTRNGDYDLASPYAYLRKRSDLFKRASLINNSDCEIYLSIHLNASPSTTWRGAQVFYDDINPENEKMAKIFQIYFKKYLSSRREYKEVNDLYMYKRIKKPGLLLEVGFISNSNERYILKQTYYQKKIANTIVKAVLEYLK
jgi:N-acetylmuramoyl-L-alanine amidase